MCAQRPYFSHKRVKETTVLKRKTIIVNTHGLPVLAPTILSYFLRYGFLVYRVAEDHLLIPMLRPKLYEDAMPSTAIGRLDLQELLKKYDIQIQHAVICDDSFFGNSSFSLAKDDLHDFVGLSLRPSDTKGVAYLYKTLQNKIAYSMINHFGWRIHQVTDIEVSGELCLSAVRDDVLKVMGKLGHVRDYVDIKQFHEMLILNLKEPRYLAKDIQELLRAHPRLEVLNIDDCVIDGELNELSLPYLKSLSITVASHQPNFARINQILQAAPDLQAIVILDRRVGSSIKTIGELWFRSEIKTLALSYQYLSMIRVQADAKLIAIELSGGKIEPSDLDLVNLNRLIQFNGLKHLDCTRLTLSEPLDLPPHVLVQYSSKSIQEMESIKDSVPLIPSINVSGILEKLIRYLQFYSDECQSIVPLVGNYSSNINQALARCLSHICTELIEHNPIAIQKAWHVYLMTIEAWAETLQPRKQNQAKKVFDRLLHELMGHRGTMHSKAVFCLSNLWLMPPSYPVILQAGKKVLQLSYQNGFWCVFDLNHSIATLEFFPQGAETSLEDRIRHQTQCYALVLKTETKNDIDLNPQPSSQKVINYCKAGGLLTLLETKDNALSYFNISDINKEDFNEIFSGNTPEGYYWLVYRNNTEFAQRLFQHYQTFDSTFTFPSFKRTHVQAQSADSQFTVPNVESKGDGDQVHVSTLAFLRKFSSGEKCLVEEAPKILRQSIVKCNQDVEHEPNEVFSWSTPVLWLGRSCDTQHPQQLCIRRLQDYLVIRHGIDEEAVWPILKNLSSHGIEHALAYCFADYWLDSSINQPSEILRAWKDTIQSLVHWNGETRSLPPINSRVGGMLQMLWYYSYHMYYAKSADNGHPYSQRFEASDLAFLRFEPLEQPLVLLSGSKARTILYREGVWYYFSPNDSSGEPDYFRRGDEDALVAVIRWDLSEPIFAYSRQLLQETVSVSASAAEGDECGPEDAVHAIFRLPELTQRVDFDPPKIGNLPEKSLFAINTLPQSEPNLSSQDPNFLFLCQASIEAESERNIEIRYQQPQKQLSCSADVPLSLGAFDSAILLREGENVLLQFSNYVHLELYFDHLLTTEEARTRGIWLVNSIRDLQCDVPSVLIQDNNNCMMLEAPAGDLFKFIQKHDSPIFAVNYSRLSTKEMLQINPILDEIGCRSIDRVSFSRRALVLSFQDIGDPDAYQGEDFLSRHDARIQVPSDLCIPAIMDTRGLDDSACHSEREIEIECYQSLHWQNYLFGSFRRLAHGTEFLPSKLWQETTSTALQSDLSQCSLKIILKNAPMLLPEMRQALYKILYLKNFCYYGRLLQLPDVISIAYQSGYSFESLPRVTLTYNPSTEYQFILNPTTVNQLFLQYRVDEQGLVTPPGLLEDYARTDRGLIVYVSRDISLDDWARVWDTMRRLNCSVTFHLASYVVLPPEVIKNHRVIYQTSIATHQVFPYVQSVDNYNKIIPVTGLKLSDLFYRLYEDKDQIVREKISDIWHSVLHGEHVLLVGTCEPEVMDALWGLVIGKGYYHQGEFIEPDGRIDVLDPSVDESILTRRIEPATGIPDSLPPEVLDQSHDYSHSLAESFHQERERQWQAATQRSPFVCLLGDTAVGKTHFMQSKPGVVIGDVSRWLRQGGHLFLDEGNLNQKINWASFKGLIWGNNPSFLYEGTYYEFKQSPTVTIAMNLANESIERRTLDVLQKYAQTVIFSNFPNASLFNDFLLPILGNCQGQSLKIGHVFLNTYLMLKSIAARSCSVRELQMMAYLFKSVPYLFPDDQRASALYHAHQLAYQVLTPKQYEAFESKFVEKWGSIPSPYRAYPGHLGRDGAEFYLVSTNHSAYAALDDFMAVLIYKQKTKQCGGLSGFVLEGPPGCGKSLFIKQYLLSKDLKENHDFIYIPGKWLPSRKIHSLLEAFHRGIKVVMEEWNASSDLLEEVLNAVLSGYDLNGNSAKVDGFAVFATQNPGKLGGGRTQASMPMERRVMHAYFSAHTPLEMLEILQRQNTPLITMYECIRERIKNPRLNFRDVSKMVQKRRAFPPPLNTIVPVPDIVLKLCKILEPLSPADTFLLQAMQKEGWQTFFYQGNDGDYYFHDRVYRNLKQQAVLFPLLHIALAHNSSGLLRSVFQYLTQKKIPMSVSLFAHLELDMEMPGLEGLQGESPLNILGYFSQYMAQLPTRDHRLAAFSRALNILLVQYQSQTMINTHNTRSQYNFEQYCVQIGDTIRQLVPGQDYFIYGGWANPLPGSSHSMIYRFERWSDAVLRFHLYNAGAGLGEHEKISTSTHERYYPVKIYEVSIACMLQSDLVGLIQRLLLPKMVGHPSRTQQDDIKDATKLYHNIEHYMLHMRADLKLASAELVPGVTTKGVMAGACTLSIQQVLNAYLNDPYLYQSVVLDLKLIAVKEFVKAYPAPRSAHINQLLILAIENNFKILLNLQWSSSSPPKALGLQFTQWDDVAQYLSTLKQQIWQESQIQSIQVKKALRLDADYTIDWVPETAKLNQVKDRSSEQKQTFSRLLEIEKAILDFNVNVFEGSSSRTIFSIHNHSALEAKHSLREASLSQLEHLFMQYQTSYKDCNGESQSTHSFFFYLTLLDACAKLAPELSNCFHKEIGAFLHGYKRCPHLGTYDRRMDEKLIAMMQNYKYIAIDYNGLIITIYRGYIAQYQDCMRLLGDLYTRKYGAVPTPLHAAIRDKQLGNLFALFNELDEEGRLLSSSNLDPANFEPLLRSIQFQMRIERIIVGCFGHLLQTEMTEKLCPKLVFSGQKLKIETQLTLASPSDKFFYNEARALTKLRYNLAPSTAFDVLDYDIPKGRVRDACAKGLLTENEIQLLKHQKKARKFLKEDLLFRALMHLRIEPSYQAILTIEYFLKEPQYLADVNNIEYIKANLFQMGVLVGGQPTATLLEKWSELVNLGLQKCKDLHGNLSHAAASLLRVNFYVKHYLRDQDGLTQDLATLNSLIEQTTDRAILSTLHQCRFLTIRALSGDFIGKDAYISYVYLQSVTNPHLPEDSAHEEVLRRAQYDFQTLLEENPLFLSNGMAETFQKYPWLEVGVDRFDLILGRLYRNDGKVRSHVPRYWKNAPILKHLGIEQEVMCWVTSDFSIVEFDGSSSVRAINIDGRWLWQKKWCLAGEEAWYEWRPLSSHQAYRYGLDPKEQGYPSIQHRLPLWLCDDESDAWVNTVHRETVLLVQYQQISYCWQKDKALYKVANNHSVAAVCPLPTTYCEHLLRFENPQFIVYTQGSDDPIGIIYFVRYALELHYDMAQDVIIHPGTQATLTMATAAPFSSEVSCLVFEKNMQAVLCLVPVQPFHVLTHEVSNLGQYYPLVQDTELYLATQYLSADYEKHHIKKKDQLPWRYAHSEQYVQFNLVEGVVKANTIADALFHIYCCLATHRLTDGWQLIQELKMRGGIRGTREELIYIEWILHKLPAADDLNDYAEERSTHETLNSPRYVACRLKILALLTQYIQQGQYLEIPGCIQDQARTANERYQALQNQKIQMLCKNLVSIIGEQYVDFQRIECYLSEEFYLEQDERYSLLSYLEKETNELHGSLGYARLEQTLSLLLRLERYLLALRLQMQGHFSEKNERRLQEIGQEIQKQIIIRKQSTCLEEVCIDLTLPDDFSQSMIVDTPDCQMLQFKDSLIDYDIDTDENAIIRDLSAGITGTELVAHLSGLLRIAQLSDPKNANKVRLIEFCKASLRAARHHPFSEQNTPVPYLANLLYRIAMNPDCFKKTEVYNWRLCIKTVQRLSVPKITMLQAKDVYAEILVTAKEMVAGLKRSLRESTRITLPDFLESEEMSPFWKEDYLGIIYDPKGDEQSVGLAMYTHMQQKRAFAAAVLTTEEKSTLVQQALACQAQLRPALQQKWSEIEFLAHKLPIDSDFKQIHSNQLHARLRHLPSQQNLFKLYLQQDYAAYYAMTGLREAQDVRHLHSLLHEYITLAVQEQTAQRLIEALGQGDALEVAELLTQSIPTSAQQDPCVMLFQYLNNKRLRPIQAEALQRLLSVDPKTGRCRDLVEKLTMGAGKTSVLVPILAQKKAIGTNLVIVELLPDLLNAQHPDMQQLSSELFQQSAHRLEFNRNSDASWQRLKQIYEQFQRIAIEKDYLVTTGQSIRALYLKYIELLLSRPEHVQKQTEWRKQVVWAEKILEFLEESGDAVFEEVHIALWQKRKMNYVFGDAGSIDAKLIAYSIQLYNMLEKDPKCRQGGAYLIKYLLTSVDSPLFEKIHTELRPLVTRYCNNRCEEIPQAILDLDEELKDLLAFYKEQSLLLPKTLSRKYKEKYGPSRLDKKNTAERRVAIPYSAKDKPEELSCFAHELQTINYTIQGALKDGLDESLLCEAIHLWQIAARNAMQDQDLVYLTLNDTPLAREINKVLSPIGFTLQTIDITSVEHRAALMLLSYNRTMIMRVLQDHILPYVKQESSVLHADAYDHVDMYHSVQGLSGTPWNKKTYKRLHSEPGVALGNDGYLQKVIENKVERVREIPFESLDTFVQALQPSANTQALIDICARFVGIESKEVANALAKYFFQRGHGIKHILYFNEAGMLCALSVGPIHQYVDLKTCDMDQVCRILHCTIEECFSYYDQPRALGMNLKQALTAKAIILLDEQTQYQSCLQGCGRMRGLEKQQTLEWIVTPGMPTAVPALFRMMQNNQDAQLLEDNVSASIDKLESIIRQDLRQIIYSIEKENIDKKHSYMLAFEEFFFDRISRKSIFEKYGQIYKRASTECILTIKQNILIEAWERCLKTAQIHFQMAKRKENLLQKMQEIISEAKKNCPEETLYRNGTQRFDQEVQRQNELELEEELEELSVFYSPDLQAVPEESWNLSSALPLKQYCGRSSPFSNDLLISANYMCVYDRQILKIDQYVKPVHFIYFFYQSGIFYQNGVLKACLVTQKEAIEIQQERSSEGGWWLSTSQHTVFAGRIPSVDLLQSSEYQNLIEQIRYFNGELHHLVSRKYPCVWLSEAMLSYYQQHIMPNRDAMPISEESKIILREQAKAKDEQLSSFTGSFLKFLW